MKRFIKDNCASLIYFLYRKGFIQNKLTVYSVDETLDLLIHTSKSLVRFGDGEITMIRGRSLKLQNVEPAIIEDLKRILGYRHKDLMVSIPDIFDGVEQYHSRSRQSWKDHLLCSRWVYKKYCNPNITYCNAFVSRCYYIFKDKSLCAGWFEKIKMIWNAKHIVVVEGVYTHNGVGNDLFDSAADVKRIIAPACNAYCKLPEIREACLKHPKDRLFLISLGAAAKPLTEQLFQDGYRVIDIGNLDMEYEWFLHNATEKEKIFKHQVMGKQENIDAGFSNYWNEIVDIIE